MDGRDRREHHLTERLPDIGEDFATVMGARDSAGGWLRVAHNDDGTLKLSANVAVVGGDLVFYTNGVERGRIALGGAFTGFPSTAGLPQGGPLTQDLASPGWAISNPAQRSFLSFGAVGDGRYLTGINSNGTTTVTSTTPMFQASDVGKVFGMWGDGTGVVAERTIAAFVSTTQVTLSASVSTHSSFTALVGTNNNAAKQAAVTWICSIPGGARVGVPPGIFVIGGAQQTGTVTSGPTSFNYTGQILYPANDRSQPMIFAEFFADRDPGGLHIPGFDSDTLSVGGQLVSLATSGFGVACIPSAVEIASQGSSFSWVMPVYNRIRFRTIGKHDGTGPGAINLYVAANGKVNNCVVDVVGISHHPPSTGKTTIAGTGVALPAGGNWGIAECIGTKIMGYPKGISASDHAVLEVMVDSCGAHICPGDLASERRVNTHGMTILKAECQRGDVVFEPMGGCSVVGKVDVEGGGVGLINDPDQLMSGDLLIEDGSIYGFGPGLGVIQAGPRMFFRKTTNPAHAGPSVDLVDSLRTHPSFQGNVNVFGVADGSNHVYYAGAQIAKDANGAYLTGAGDGNAISWQGPFYLSRNIELMLHTSPTAGRTWRGALSRVVVGGGYDGLKVICSNNAGGTGIYIFKGAGFATQIAHAAFTFAASTTYRINILTQQKSYDPATVTVTVYVNGVSALTYTLSGGEAAAYVAYGYDGITGVFGAAGDDGGSRLTDLYIRRENNL